jgi:peptidoglycan/LPS O-acetylase OafA/YrhL
MIRNVQALRALAALLVLYAHLNHFADRLGLPVLGGQGVDLFFVISGFVMVYTTSSHPPTAGEFVRSRIARIVPIYWLITLVVYLLALIVPSVLKSTRAEPLDLVRSLLFVPYRRADGEVAPVLFVGWTLNYEMFFYTLFALGLLAKRYLYGLASVVACLVVLSVIGAVARPSGVLASFYTQSRMIEFGLGMLIGIFATRSAQRSSTPGGLIPTLALGGLGFAAMLVLPLMWPSAPMLITAGLAAAVVVWAAVGAERSGLAVRSVFIFSVGDASYVLYLTHAFVTVAAWKLIGAHLSRGSATALAAVGTAMICVQGACWLHRVLELPVSRAARRLLQVERRRAVRLSAVALSGLRAS